jgi:hypothetical protein
MRILNRWDQVIFETTDIHDGWDGSYNGREQDIGTFVYIVGR